MHIEDWQLRCYASNGMTKTDDDDNNDDDIL